MHGVSKHEWFRAGSFRERANWLMVLGLATISTLLAGCNAGNGATAALAGSTSGSATAAYYYTPGVDTTWQIQLQGTVNTGYNVAVYDIDLFDTPTTLIDDLHLAGHRVICYFSAGSYENWRPDKDQFLSSDLGNNLSGWPGERWLDIRSDNVRSIMLARLDMAAAKGCDGVDPDNVDGYSNKSGFPLTAADQLAYNRFLADAAHGRGLAVGLKNDLEQVKKLVASFDFAVNESCHEYDECDMLAPFPTAGKPVFHIEYTSSYVNDPSARAALCADSAARRFRTLVLPEALDDSFRFSCD